MVDGEWNYKVAGCLLLIDPDLNAPASSEEALDVLRKEATYRLSKEYLAKTAPYIKKM